MCVNAGSNLLIQCTLTSKPVTPRRSISPISAHAPYRDGAGQSRAQPPLQLLHRESGGLLRLAARAASVVLKPPCPRGTTLGVPSACDWHVPGARRTRDFGGRYIRAIPRLARPVTGRAVELCCIVQMQRLGNAEHPACLHLKALRPRRFPERTRVSCSATAAAFGRSRLKCIPTTRATSIASDIQGAWRPSGKRDSRRTVPKGRSGSLPAETRDPKAVVSALVRRGCRTQFLVCEDIAQVSVSGLTKRSISPHKAIDHVADPELADADLVATRENLGHDRRRCRGGPHHVLESGLD